MIVFSRIHLYKSSAQWLSTKGVITRSVIVKYMASASSARTASGDLHRANTTEYVIDMTYTYEVNGVRFEGYSILPDYESSSLLSPSNPASQLSVQKIRSYGNYIVPLNDSEIDYIKKEGGKYNSDISSDYKISAANILRSLESAVSLQKIFSEGQNVDVYYNPSNPNEAGLVTKEVSSNRLIIFMSVVVVIIGATIFLAIIKL